MVYITTFNSLKNFAFCDSCDEPFLSFKRSNSLFICRCEVRDAHVFIISSEVKPLLIYLFVINHQNLPKLPKLSYLLQVFVLLLIPVIMRSLFCCYSHSSGFLSCFHALISLSS